MLLQYYYYNIILLSLLAPPPDVYKAKIKYEVEEVDKPPRAITKGHH